MAGYASPFGRGRIVFGELGAGIDPLALAAAAFAWIARSFRPSASRLSRWGVLPRRIRETDAADAHKARADAHKARLYG